MSWQFDFSREFEVASVKVIVHRSEIYDPDHRFYNDDRHRWSFTSSGGSSYHLEAEVPDYDKITLFDKMTLFIDTFPVLVAFENLDMQSTNRAHPFSDSFEGPFSGFKRALLLRYLRVCTYSNWNLRFFIGSSIDLGERIMDHILNHSSNLHLHNAIVKYGLSHFAFVILEYCHSSDLLKREQHYLDLLFSLAKELRYNFSSIAS